MAQHVEVRITDDIDGSADAETRVFAIGRTTYEIDLGPKNQKAFDKDMARWAEHARKVSSGSRGSIASPVRRARHAGEPDAAAVRAWAQENNIEVSDRGRIPASVMESYLAAQ